MNKDNIIKEISNKYINSVNYDVVNKMIEITDNKDLGIISKKTITNIAKWALNGASEKEIATNLELTEKQFKTLVSLCPVVVYVMQESREYADVVVAGSLLQRAIGGSIVRRQQPVKVSDYDEDGKKIGEHIEIVNLEEELPPDSNLLKYLAEHKFSEKFGNGGNNVDERMKRVVGELNEEQIAKIEELQKLEELNNGKKS